MGGRGPCARGALMQVRCSRGCHRGCGNTRGALLGEMRARTGLQGINPTQAEPQRARYSADADAIACGVDCGPVQKKAKHRTQTIPQSTTPLATQCPHLHYPTSAVRICGHAADGAAGASTPTSVSRATPNRHASSRLRMSSTSRSRPITTSWLILSDPSGQSSSSNW